MQCSHNGKEINISVLEVALEYKMRFQLNNRDFLEGKAAKKRSKRRINGDGQSRDCTTIHHSSTVEIHKNQQTYLGNYRLLTIEYHIFFLGVFFLSQTRIYGAYYYLQGKILPLKGTHPSRSSHLLLPKGPLQQIHDTPIRLMRELWLTTKPKQAE